MQKYPGNARIGPPLQAPLLVSASKAKYPSYSFSWRYRSSSKGRLSSGWRCLWESVSQQLMLHSCEVVHHGGCGSSFHTTHQLLWRACLRHWISLQSYIIHSLHTGCKHVNWGCNCKFKVHRYSVRNIIFGSIFLHAGAPTLILFVVITKHKHAYPLSMCDSCVWLHTPGWSTFWSVTLLGWVADKLVNMPCSYFQALALLDWVVHHIVDTVFQLAQR